MSKEDRIKELLTHIDNFVFKIKAKQLEAKYCKKPYNAIKLALELLNLQVQLRMTYAQIQIVISQPIPKQGLGIVGFSDNNNEVIVN